MQSLRVDESLLVDFVMGDPRARLIVESWRFHEPITIMSSEEFDILTEHCHTDYHDTLNEGLGINGNLGYCSNASFDDLVERTQDNAQ